MKEERTRISYGTAAMMLAVAAAFDAVDLFEQLLNAVPVVGTAMVVMLDLVITLPQGLTFWLWFKMHDVTLGDSLEKMLTNFVLWFLEWTPVGILPLWTVSVVITLIIVWREDREYNKQVRRENARLAKEAKEQVDRQIILLRQTRAANERQEARQSAPLRQYGAISGVASAPQRQNGESIPREGASPRIPLHTYPRGGPSNVDIRRRGSPQPPKPRRYGENDSQFAV